MASGRGDTRAELSRLLSADAAAGYDPKPPDVAASSQLHALIASSLDGSQEHHRVVYEHLPLLMLRFFGFAPGTGWLETGCALPGRARDALMAIVRPGGPVMEYCLARSEALAAEPRDGDWRYEFPVANLPPGVADDFYELADNPGVYNGTSFSALAAPLVPCLRRGHDGTPPDVLLLSPVDYFLVCMLSSPAHKYVHPSQAGVGGSRRRVRRSSSLPSTRAMYNLVLSEHLAHALRLSPACSGGGKSLLIPAVVDLLFAPLVGGVVPGTFDFSAPTADAAATVLLSLRPSDPSQLLLSSGAVPANTYSLYPAKEAAVAYVHACVPELVKNSLLNFPPDGALPTLAAFLRLFALYLAPGSSEVAVAMEAALYPKKSKASGAASGTAGSSPSLAKFTSTLSSLNAQLQQLPASTRRGGGNGSKKDDAALWQTAHVMTSRHEVNRGLLRLAVFKSVKTRVGATAEGAKALGLIADAVCASGLDCFEGGVGGSNVDETRTYLHALGEQISEGERTRLGRSKTKSCIPTLGLGLGVKMQSAGTMTKMAEMVGVSARGASSMASHLQGSGGGSGSKGRLKERRQSELQGSIRSNVPVLGTVWERPIESGEIEFTVVQAYRFAVWIECWSGRLPNIRWLGRADVLVMGVVAVFIASLFIKIL